MTNIIKIKRSATQVTPAALAQGELAYSESTGTGDGELFIGIAGSQIEKIGGYKDVQKLLGIEAGANNYVLPEATSTVKGGVELFSDTDQVVAPNTITATAGRTYGIQLNADGQAVVNVPWVDNDTIYTLPEATSTIRGGVELFSDTDNPAAANSVSSNAGRTYGLQLNADGQGVVNVPWTDTLYTLPLATSTVRGGIELGDAAQQTTAQNAVTTTAARTYALQINAAEQGVVNVPWTDTVYSLPPGSTTVLGGIKLADDTVQAVAAEAVTATAARTYGVQVNASGQAVINVPWTSGGTYTLPLATDTVRGGIELSSAVVQSVAANAVTTTASRTYGVQVNSNEQAVVNIPWVEGIPTSSLLDSDTMTGATASNVPSAESVVAYIAAQLAGVTGGVEMLGGYDASTGLTAVGSKNLDTSPVGVKLGDMYYVTVAGSAFFGVALEIGDSLISNQNDPTLLGHWTILQGNLQPSDLSVGTVTATNVPINISYGADITTLPAATQTLAGIMIAGAQTFGGVKTFEDVSGTDTGAILDSFVIDGGTF